MEKMILITDPNCDPDDLISYVTIANFMDAKQIELKAVIATLGNSKTIEKRARFAKGAFACMGCDVPVAAGAAHPTHDKGHDNFYCPNPVNRKIGKMGTRIGISAYELLSKTFHFEKDKSITILVNANMFDLGEFLCKDSELFSRKVRKIVVMGAGDVVSGRVVPSIKSYNNVVSFTSSQAVFNFAQDNDIELVLVPKDTVYKVHVGFAFYENLDKCKNPLAISLARSHKTFLEKLWNSVKKGVYQHFTMERFREVFMDDNEELCENFSFEKVYPRIKKFNLYDAIAVMAAVENYWLKYGHYNKLLPNKKVYIADIDDKVGFGEELYNILLRVRN